MLRGWCWTEPAVEQELVLILARATNGTIGRDGTLPWRIPADLRRFRALTMGRDGTGRPMIMGRRTFDSLGKPLAGRRHIVLTRDTGWKADGAEVVHTPGDALLVAGSGEIAIIGGAEIYALFLPIAHRIELTEVHAEIDGDTHMPPFGEQWRETFREEHPADDGRPAYAFVTLVRDV